MTHLHTITKAAAGTAFAAAFLLSAPAAATPPLGLGISNIVNGHYGTLHVNSDKAENPWDLFLKTKGDSDIGAQRITLEPQGTSGWHSHPAPIFLTVTKGSIEYTDSLLCTPQTLTAGQSIIEPAYRVNTIVNPASAGGEVAEMVGIVIKPTSVVGPALRIDAQVPNNCD